MADLACRGEMPLVVGQFTQLPPAILPDTELPVRPRAPFEAVAASSCFAPFLLETVMDKVPIAGLTV